MESISAHKKQINHLKQLNEDLFKLNDSIMNQNKRLMEENKVLNERSGKLQASYNSRVIKKQKPKWKLSEIKVSYKKSPVNVPVTSSGEAFTIFRHLWDRHLINIQEQLFAIYLDNNKNIIAYRNISTGKMDQVTADVHLIFTCALKCRASSMIIAHNHPSGNHKPSKNDERFTIQVKHIGDWIGIKLNDSLILDDQNYFSFYDSGHNAWSNEERAQMIN